VIGESLFLGQKCLGLSHLVFESTEGRVMTRFSPYRGIFLVDCLHLVFLIVVIFI